MANENMDLTMNSLEDLGSDLFGQNDEAELAAIFAADIAAIEEEASLSQDLDGFAKGFPDWDVHPPKKR